MNTALIQNKPLYDGLKVTREEYLDLKDDGFQYDMIEGVLHMSPSAYSEHNEAMSLIIALFVNYFSKGKLGKVLPETDIYLPDGGDVLRPDISIILKGNYGIIIGHIHGVPDIVVEILSEATRSRDLGIKAERYLSNGVKEYWIANPDNKSIELWINVDNGSTLSTGSVQASSQTKNWKKTKGDRLESNVLDSFIMKQELVFPTE